MAKLLNMSRAAAALMLVASISLESQMAFAEPDAEQDSIVVSVDPNETSSTADADALEAVSGVSDPAVQGDAVDAEKVAKKPEKTGKQADASILSANPDDANKHSAWRKREADKAKSDLQTLRHSMQQGGQ